MTDDLTQSAIIKSENVNYFPQAQNAYAMWRDKYEETGDITKKRGIEMLTFCHIVERIGVV